MQFSPRAGDATIFKKIASPSQATNRSCSRGLIIASLLPWLLATAVTCYELALVLVTHSAMTAQ